ncbi:hypothetical protein HOP50_04g34840 [Chloropicon primus]|uniref:Domain of unknown function at the cortex 1 domain-containing protein n=1 Tax=Chloropicon primus TaxID=1764295 RepID=A0A5B8MKP6_9CHLO|nr:hypothetical protein A3770_04p34770 [Chloropicon primus]UPR00170.1 hypothetical protein HOP50_04g34840 [Chloropicon primus]|eukprot:QDZ20959.1 hypothetical protein A3770_04p34770 [Chloropicon primus]
MAAPDLPIPCGAARGRVRDVHEAATGGLPPVEAWPERPVLVTMRKEMDPQEVPVSTAVEIPVSTRLFHGTVKLFVRVEAEAADDHRSKDSYYYFRGRRRLAGVILRGKFKDGLRMDSVYAGNWFEAPIRMMKQRGIVLGVIRRLLPHLHLGMDFIAAPLILDAKRMAVYAHHEACAPTCGKSLSVDEKTDLLGGFFAQQARSPRERRAFLRKTGLCFREDHVYEFELYQDKVNFQTYDLKLPLVSVNVGSILGGQPMQFGLRLKTSGGEDEWVTPRFSFWSEDLLRQRQVLNST